MAFHILKESAFMFGCARSLSLRSADPSVYTWKRSKIGKFQRWSVTRSFPPIIPESKHRLGSDRKQLGSLVSTSAATRAFIPISAQPNGTAPISAFHTIVAGTQPKVNVS